MLRSDHSESIGQLALPVCLGNGNSNRLASLLWIMELFRLWDHQDAFERLQTLMVGLELRVEQGHGNEPPTDEHKQRCVTTLSLMEEECMRLGFNSGARELISFTTFEAGRG